MILLQCNSVIENFMPVHVTGLGVGTASCPDLQLQTVFQNSEDDHRFIAVQSHLPIFTGATDVIFRY